MACVLLADGLHTASHFDVMCGAEQSERANGDAPHDSLEELIRTHSRSLRARRVTGIN
jgi:hypothetical protein